MKQLWFSKGCQGMPRDTFGLHPHPAQVTCVSHILVDQSLGRRLHLWRPGQAPSNYNGWPGEVGGPRRQRHGQNWGGRFLHLTIWLFNRAMENHGKSPFFIGKPSINGPFSMAMLNNQRVTNLDYQIFVQNIPRQWKSNDLSSREFWSRLICLIDLGMVMPQQQAIQQGGFMC